MEEMWELGFRDELNASPSEQVADEKVDRHLKAPSFVWETKKNPLQLDDCTFYQKNGLETFFSFLKS